MQALALEAKRRVTEKNQQKQHVTEAQTSAGGVTEKRSVSLLNTLLGSDSEEAPSQNDSEDEADVSSHSVREEILKYFGEQPLPKSTDPLQWWKANEGNFPTLAVLAKSYLCVPATSTPSERLFSTAGNKVSKKRASLTPEHVDMLTFLLLLLQHTSNRCLIPVFELDLTRQHCLLH